MPCEVRRIALAAVAVLAALLGGCATQTAGHPRAGAPPATAGHHSTPSVASPASSPAPPAPVRRVVTPCTANRQRKWVFVSIRRQHMWMCARHRIAYDTPITSGMVGQYTNTPTGRFVIQGRTRNTWLTLIDGSSYAVKYWIPFDGPLFGFHDSSWQHFAYGSPKYRTHGSHGCVHMPLPAIRFLYRWGDTGTPVRITR
jgi:L,D-transpeptidase catalytic domain